jgi:DNA-directed RNA polymerase II subunit RPB1
LSNFGIEAVFNYLDKEIPKILKQEGLKVNHEHIELIANAMTHNGHIVQKTRHGMKTSEGVILKATFETPMNTFIEASVNRITDEIKCVSSAVLTGCLGTFGSNVSKIVEREIDPDDPEKSYPVMEIDDDSNMFVYTPEYAPVDDSEDDGDDDDEMGEVYIPCHSPGHELQVELDI